MSNWDKIFKPIVVLCVICIIITGALAATNSVTAPIIDAATKAAQEAARKELLPDADNFTRVDCTVENVSDVYVADNGVGMVITSTGKGYGGNVTVMTAVNPDGTIKQIKITEAAETKGIGTNVTENTEYWDTYAGKSAAQALVLDQDVDRYTGATISSRALNSAVNSAIEAYNTIS